MITNVCIGDFYSLLKGAQSKLDR